MQSVACVSAGNVGWWNGTTFVWGLDVPPCNKTLTQMQVLNKVVANRANTLEIDWTFCSWSYAQHKSGTFPLASIHYTFACH